MAIELSRRATTSFPFQTGSNLDLHCSRRDVLLLTVAILRVVVLYLSKYLADVVQGAPQHTLHMLLSAILARGYSMQSDNFRQVCLAPSFSMFSNKPDTEAKCREDKCMKIELHAVTQQRCPSTPAGGRLVMAPLPISNHNVVLYGCGFSSHWQIQPAPFHEAHLIVCHPSLQTSVRKAFDKEARNCVASPSGPLGPRSP